MFNRFIPTVLVLSAMLTSLAEEAPFMVLPSDSKTIVVLKDGNPYIDFSLSGFGPNWSYIGLNGSLSSSADTLAAGNTGRSGGATITIDAEAFAIDKKTFEVTYKTSSSQPIALTMLTAGLNFDPNAFAGAHVLVTTADGQTRKVEMPLDKSGLGEAVESFTLVDANGLETVLSFDPACEVASDIQARIVLAGKSLNEPTTRTIKISLPDTLDFYANAEDVPLEPSFEEWYAFNPSTDFSSDSEIGMADWLEKPAGKHGRITRKDDELIYNGQPIKLWGLNVTYGGCAPDHRIADRRAAMYAKYGMNSVRLHKYADGSGWAGILTPSSFLEFDTAALDRMDYFVSRLKEAGIYIKLSPNFGVKVGQKDRDLVPYVNELGTPDRNGKIYCKHGSIWLSKELQDMHIQQLVNILEHKNSYTGERYADDPAVTLVELYNEDSALFYGTMAQLQKSPTLRKRAAEKFTNWLKEKYGSKEALLEAWGGEASLNCFVNEGFTSESWEARSIVPAGSPWLYDPDQLNGEMSDRKQRLLDTMQFLYEIQNEFYDRYVKAIRDTGYKGEIMASNWQAGRAFSHYYNLHSDYQIGLIDRHNYFGGGSWSRIKNDTMLTHPGTGIFSAGMQQVADRPFSLSEWIHVQPNEWGLEGPAIIGAYGMGLQGWDVSYIFENDDSAQFNSKLNEKLWNGVTAPNILGFFPAVSRQVLRGDIQQSAVKATRYVHMPTIKKGIIDFDEKIVQSGDVKSFTGDKVPDLALAAARCVVEFTDEPKPTPVFDMAAHTAADGTILATTGELSWKPGEEKLDGFFTIDTPATKAVVGFAEGEKLDLSGITIEPHSRFGAIYITAQNPNEDLKSGDTAILVAMARARNTDMNVRGDELILTQGTAPVVMKPVKAAISMNRSIKSVELLDHDGCRTGNEIDVKGYRFEIDGARDQTCYYLITF